MYIKKLSWLIIFLYFIFIFSCNKNNDTDTDFTLLLESEDGRTYSAPGLHSLLDSGTGEPGFRNFAPSRARFYLRFLGLAALYRQPGLGYE